jgi:hypothetical protein
VSGDGIVPGLTLAYLATQSYLPSREYLVAADNDENETIDQPDCAVEGLVALPQADGDTR